MLRRLLMPMLAALTTLALAAPWSMPVAAAPVFPTGLRVGLEPPAGLVASRRIPGFEDLGHHVLVAIFQFPGQAYDKLMHAGFDHQTQGMTHVSKADFAVAGGKGYLVSGEIRVKDQDQRRWFLLARPDGNASGGPLTAVIRVDVPKAAREVYSDAVVRKMLASVEFRATPIKELLGLLPFKFGDLAGFHVASVLPGGAVLTDGPGDRIGKVGQPYFIVAMGRGGPRDPALRGTFARDMLRRGPLSNIRVTSADSIRIGRAPALELRATAQDPTGQTVHVVQWLRFGTGGYMRMIGVAPKGDWNKLFQRFRAVRDGVTSR